MFGGRTGDGRRISERSNVKDMKRKEFEGIRVRLRLDEDEIKRDKVRGVG